MHTGQQLGHQGRGANKDQRACPEARLFPDPLEIPPIVGGEADAADGTGGEPGADNGDDARDFKQFFGQQINDIGQCQRQRHLGQTRTAEKGQDRPEKASTDGTEDHPTEKGLGEMHRTSGKVRVRTLRKHADEHRKQHDRCSVVEQALAFEKPSEPSRRSQLVEDRHHRSRIGRRNDCAKQQCHGQRQPGSERQAEADRRGRGKNGDDRQCQNRRPIRCDLAQVDHQRRVKQQHRQEHDEEDRRVKRQVYDRPDDIVERACQRGVEQKGRQAADRNPDDGEEHGIGQVEPLRRGLDHAGESQKPGDD